MKLRSITTHAAPGLACALLLAACGGSEKPTGPAEGKPTALEVTATQPGATRFRLAAPSTIPAGLIEITLRNEGRQPSDAQLIHVTGGQTAEQVVSALRAAMQRKGLPDWFRAAGGVTTTAPGQTGTVQQVLKPGTYYVVDDESAGEDGPGHFEQGAITKLEVTAGGPGTLPSAPATVKTFEYGFQDQGLKAGTLKVRFDNIGAQPHHIVFAPILAGKTLADVKKFVATEEPSGPPPVDFENGASTTVMDGKESQVATLKFAKPGKYALICFISDRAGGPPHTARGMVAETTVTAG